MMLVKDFAFVLTCRFRGIAPQWMNVALRPDH